MTINGIHLYIHKHYTYSIFIIYQAINSLESFIMFKLYNTLDNIPVFENIAKINSTTTMCGTIIGKFNKKYLNFENLSLDMK